MRTIIAGIAMTVTSLAPLGLAVALESTPIMPDELIAYAAKNDCDQVDDFFKRPGMVNPPYAYGYLSGLAEDSAVLWCQLRHGGERKYLLLVMMKRRDDELAKCPTRIVDWRDYPGGLSIYRDTRTTLEGFVYLADPKKRGPRNVKLSANAILSEYDGVTDLFYCYKGEWLIRQRH